MQSATARIAGSRVVDLRHTAPIVRVGTGLLNCLMRSVRALLPPPPAASSGSSVHAVARGDHLAQRLQARRPIVRALAHADATADFERLVAQAVPVLEQQQRLVGEVGDPDAIASGQFVARRHRQREGLVVQ